MSSKTAVHREHAIREAIAAREDDLIALTSKLIGYDTTAGDPAEPSRNKESEVQALLEARLSAAGGETDLWEPDASTLTESRRQLPLGLTFDGRPQLLARFRGSHIDARSLLINGHIDVVAANADDGWTSNPFEARFDGGALYGRGACDMKGGVACAVVAAEVLRDLEMRFQGDLLVNFVTDEETSGAGTLASAARGVEATMAIVPEATDFKVWTACRGSLLPTITVPGRAGHAEIEQRPWQEGGAVNAIEKARVVMGAIDGLRERWHSTPTLAHARLSRPDIVPTIIAGGDWQVTHPAACTISYDITYLPEQTDAEGWGSVVEAELVAAVTQAASGDTWLRENPPLISWGIDVPPLDIADNEPVVKLALGLGDAIGRDVSLAERAAWHDGVTLNRFGTPSVAWGPGGFDRAHSVDEHVMVDDLVACTQGLALAAYRFLGEHQ